MQELGVVEIDEVSGGIWQFVAGVAVGIAANYAYESMGGKEGIDKMLKEVADCAYYYYYGILHRFSLNR